ncbi:MAG: Nramp family divalent metal transporter [Flavobacteriaceae bacterium]|nr:Nramp family divalent metal transporter [Flavobacteriaceae bacterium]MCY4267424.1 Nramp family divalent metal transporter [Flavobacteriaceae bacterium]MCY4298992.1 Nramp family divalent metal transporter [Flavobacteriaceae bacterium]
MSRISIAKLGPGLLFAGCAVGVSHLVQSTRAGADFGWGLIWALLLINLFKYPFFQYGPRYALSTGESLLDGYYRLGKGYLILYFILNIVMMFTVQAAVTVVTAGLAIQLFGSSNDIVLWCILLIVFCSIILVLGKYKFLDGLIKIIMIVLAVCSITAVVVTFVKGTASPDLTMTQIMPKGSEVLFLLAFMGWMPAHMDGSVWYSMWAIEKSKNQKVTYKESLFDFNVGYLASVILAICFLALGAMVMFGSGEIFSSQGAEFAGQLINLYTSTMGRIFFGLIAVAAFATMLSTTITCLDASPRVMTRSVELMVPQSALVKRKNSDKKLYGIWMILLAVGTSIIFLSFLSEMGTLVRLATVLSFISAPIYATLNLAVVTSKHMPKERRPSPTLKLISILGIVFLLGFTGYFVSTLF